VLSTLASVGQACLGQIASGLGIGAPLMGAAASAASIGLGTSCN
jgi:hypothetical protein